MKWLRLCHGQHLARASRSARSGWIEIVLAIDEQIRQIVPLREERVD